MKYIAKSILLILLFLGLSGCAEEVDRIVFTNLDEVSKVISVESGSIDIWVDLDISYQNDFDLFFNLEILQGNKEIYKTVLTLDSINLRKNNLEISAGSKVREKFEGKFRFKSSILEKGEYEFKITPHLRGNISKLQLLDIIIKQ
ncbi:hypothetical protein OAN96_01425 [Candidatus Gracilibacteria bacterium]|nr:hypothetical protein [Candidatus Gracilibacteria bacterium]